MDQDRQLYDSAVRNGVRPADIERLHVTMNSRTSVPFPTNAMAGMVNNNGRNPYNGGVSSTNNLYPPFAGPDPALQAQDVVITRADFRSYSQANAYAGNGYASQMPEPDYGNTMRPQQEVLADLVPQNQWPNPSMVMQTNPTVYSNERQLLELTTPILALNDDYLWMDGPLANTMVDPTSIPQNINISNPSSPAAKNLKRRRPTKNSRQLPRKQNIGMPDLCQRPKTQRNTPSVSSMGMGPMSNPIDVSQQAIALLEQQLQTLSFDFSKQKGADLIRKLKDLFIEDKLYSQPGPSNLTPTSTESVSQESHSFQETPPESVTDITSESSRTPTDDLSPVDVSKVHALCKDCGSKPHIFFCEKRDCPYSTHSLTDWKRHEGGDKHYPQEKYMCLLCEALTATLDPNQIRNCQYCFTALPTDQNAHYLQCAGAQKHGRTFGRRDHLLKHIETDHNVRPQDRPQVKSWKYPINSNWPRECGFCGEVFEVWEARLKHIGDHFQDGLDMSTWRLPRKAPKACRPKEPELLPPSDESDDDDDDFDDSHNFRKTPTPYNQSPTQPKRQSQHGSSSTSQPNVSGGQGQQWSCHITTDLVLLKQRVMPQMSQDTSSLALQRYLDDPDRDIIAQLNLKERPESESPSVDQDQECPGISQKRRCLQERRQDQKRPSETQLQANGQLIDGLCKSKASPAVRETGTTCKGAARLRKQRSSQGVAVENSDCSLLARHPLESLVTAPPILLGSIPGLKSSRQARQFLRKNVGALLKGILWVFQKVDLAMLTNFLEISISSVTSHRKKSANSQIQQFWRCYITVHFPPSPSTPVSPSPQTFQVSMWEEGSYLCFEILSGKDQKEKKLKRNVNACSAPSTEKNIPSTEHATIEESSKSMKSPRKHSQTHMVDPLLPATADPSEAPKTNQTEWVTTDSAAVRHSDFGISREFMDTITAQVKREVATLCRESQVEKDPIPPTPQCDTWIKSQSLSSSSAPQLNHSSPPGHHWKKDMSIKNQNFPLYPHQDDHKTLCNNFFKLSKEEPAQLQCPPAQTNYLNEWHSLFSSEIPDPARRSNCAFQPIEGSQSSDYSGPWKSSFWSGTSMGTDEFFEDYCSPMTPSSGCVPMELSYSSSVSYPDYSQLETSQSPHFSTYPNPPSTPPSTGPTNVNAIYRNLAAAKAPDKLSGVSLYSRFALAGAVCCSISHGGLTLDNVKSKIQPSPFTFPSSFKSLPTNTTSTSNKEQCPRANYGKLFKLKTNLQMHLPVRQPIRRPEKCTIQNCDYRSKNLALKADLDKHTLTHHNPNMICGFCCGPPAEKSFNQADLFKRHLTSVHAVQHPPPQAATMVAAAGYHYPLPNPRVERASGYLREESLPVSGVGKSSIRIIEDYIRTEDFLTGRNPPEILLQVILANVRPALEL